MRDVRRWRRSAGSTARLTGCAERNGEGDEIGEELRERSAGFRGIADDGGRCANEDLVPAALHVDAKPHVGDTTDARQPGCFITLCRVTTIRAA